MDTPLKNARRARGLTQEEAASAVGIGQAFLCRLENGQASASPRTAAKLAKFYDIPVTDILYPPTESRPSGEAA